MKIAIVGAGISGLVAAYKLSKKHHITIFEKGDYIGGHTNTIDVPTNNGQLAIDTGFIVFNKKTYPNFLGLLKELDVAYQPTEMSFSSRCETSGLEYNGTNLNRLFAQRKNLLNPKFYRFILGITKFNRMAKEFLHHGNKNATLGEFIKQCKIPPKVVSHYLVPMAAAVWSADPKLMWEFPAKFVLRFWDNHGFLEINDRPQWYVIKGGSRNYVIKLTESFKNRIRLDCPVKSIRRSEAGVNITTEVGQEKFDKVILACHSNQARNMISDITPEENNALAGIPYQRNTAVLHTDSSVLPRSNLAHAAWNYFLPKIHSELVTVHYHMNILQTLATKETYVVSLNPSQAISEDKILKRIEYEHPVFSPEGLNSQIALRKLSGNKHTFFAGAYMRYGFHEDGVLSGLHAAKRLEDEDNAQ